MKRHEMVLDFTSLLDVILIILFLVLCTMNGKAQKDAKAIDELETANQAYAAETAAQQEEIEALTGENNELNGKYEEVSSKRWELVEANTRLESELRQAQDQLRAAQENLKTYMEISSASEADRALYGLFKEKALYLEIRITAANLKNFCRLSMYRDGKLIGISPAFYPGNTSNWELLLQNNTRLILDWFYELFEKNYGQAAYELVLVAVNPDYDNILDKSTEVVNKALQSIEADNAKGFQMYHTELSDSE